MTDLLTHVNHPAEGPPGHPRTRPLWAGAALAGVTAAGTGLAGCMLLALVGWYSSSAGAFGDTRDALRVGADAWLLGHGAHLRLPTATIAMTPLGLTLLAGYVAYRCGRRVARACAVPDVRALAVGALTLAGGYAVAAVLTAVLVTVPDARPSLGGALVGAFVVALAGGGAGLALATGRPSGWGTRVPETLRAVRYGGTVAALLMVAAAALLLAVALLLGFGTAANVLARLHTDVAGGLLATALVAAVTPNAVLLAGAYLVGPGFAFGAGTVVSPGAVVLGPVPAFPLLAALPPPGSTSPWTGLFLAAPVVLGVVAAALTGRRYPARGYLTGTLRGLGTGVAGGLLLGLTVALAGGGVGPGRMSQVGAPVGLVTLAAVTALGLGGLAGGVGGTWWTRRHSTGPEPTGG